MSNAYGRARSLFIFFIANVCVFVLVEGAYSVFFNKHGTPALLWQLLNKISIVSANQAKTSTPPKIKKTTSSPENNNSLHSQYILGYEHLAKYSKILGESGLIIGGDSIATVNKINKDAFHTSGHDFGKFKRFDEDGKQIGFEPNQIYYTGQIKFLELNSNKIFRVPNLYSRFNEFSPEAERFRQQYVSNWVKQTIDANGFRTTLKPLGDNNPVILCIGDSLTWGAYTNDNQTYCSQIAEQFPNHQLLNAGVMGAQFDDNLARLGWVLNRYGKFTEAVIYQHSANDMFLPNGDILKPEHIVAELMSVLSKHNIKNIIFFAHHHALYTVPKSLAKVDTKLLAVREKMNRRLQIAAEKAGFNFLSTKRIFEQELKNTGSQYAPLSLLTDHTHMSVKGHKKLGLEISKILKNIFQKTD